MAKGGRSPPYMFAQKDLRRVGSAHQPCLGRRAGFSLPQVAGRLKPALVV